MKRKWILIGIAIREPTGSLIAAVRIAKIRQFRCVDQ